MSDWENWEEENAAPVKQTWEDEEDVKDSWDAESDKESKVQQKKLPPVKNKGVQQKKIKQKEEELKLKAKAKEELQEETAEERKKRLQNSVLQSDLENARALIGDLELADVPKQHLPDSIVTLCPDSKSEFDHYCSLLSKKFSDFEV
jgi:hypothetical protein